MHALHFFVKYVHKTDSQKPGNDLQQEPMSRSMQLHYISVTASL